MRHFTDAARLAALDARRESMLSRQVGLRDDNRQPGRLLLDIGSTVIDLHLEPDRRDVRMWRAYRNGEPYLRAGLERIWRKAQSEIHPPLGRRHWA